MRLPRVRFSIRAMMALVLLVALVAGAAAEVLHLRTQARRYQTHAVNYQRLKWIDNMTKSSLDVGIEKLKANLDSRPAGWKALIDPVHPPGRESSFDFTQRRLMDLENRAESERVKAERYARLADAYAEAARRPWFGPPEGEKDTPE